MDDRGTQVTKHSLVQHEGLGLGVVLSISDEKACVLFDDSPEMVWVNSTTLSRIQLKGTVSERGTERIGLVIRPVDSDAPKWEVVFSPIEGTEIKDEGALRPASAADPVERLLARAKHGSAKDTALATAAHYLMSQHESNELVSLGVARVDIKPHQVSVVHRVLSNPPHRFLLSDEVGLGKTIEAGMIIKELLARGTVRRILVIVPSSLRRQWQFELKSKFNEVFPILDSNTVRVLENSGKRGNPFTYDGMERVIVSENWIVEDAIKNHVLSVDWDLLIVDEAHHARKHKDGKQTRLYQLIKQLTEHSHDSNLGVLFLTATPMQLSTEELYSLIEMLDPTLFPSEEDFTRFRKRLPELNALVKLLTDAASIRSLPHETLEAIRAWIEANPEEFEKLVSRNDRQGMIDLLEKRHLIAEVLIRNRKAKVGENLPRRAHRLEVELSAPERAVLELIEDYVDEGLRRAAGLSNNSLGFQMTNYQKMLASSLRAIRDSLERRRAKVSGQPSQESGVVDYEELAALVEDLELDEAPRGSLANHSMPSDGISEVAALSRIIESLDAIKVDSKCKVLVEKMREFKSEEVPKVLIFTGYRGTQNYLSEVLKSDGWSVSLFHGSQSVDQKDAAVEQFRTGEGPQVLISTEAGAEGRNFQFCNILVNYDLPWNPMVVEQRIGRVDRIGQTRIVLIFNLCVKDSIEERILDVLERRINMFEETVGGLDPILGEVAEDVRKIMKSAREDRPKAIEHLGTRLQGQVAEAREANERLQDLIIDTKSFSVGIAERILGGKSEINAEVQEVFMQALLISQGTYIKRDNLNKEYSVVFHDPFRADHPSLFVDSNDTRRRVVFRADERVDSEYVQYLAFGHPVIDAAMRKVCASRWQGAAGSRRLLANEEVPPTAGWLFLYRIAVPDIRQSFHLLPVFVPDDGEVDLSLGNALMRRAASVGALGRTPSESDAPVHAESLKRLLVAREIAKDCVDSYVRQRTDELQKTASERIDNESRRYRSLYEYKFLQCDKKIEHISKSLENMRQSSDSEQQRIIPVLEKNLANAMAFRMSLDAELQKHEDRLNELRNPFCSWKLLQVSRVEVVVPSLEIPSGIV